MRRCTPRPFAGRSNRSGGDQRADLHLAGTLCRHRGRAEAIPARAGRPHRRRRSRHQHGPGLPDRAGQTGPGSRQGRRHPPQDHRHGARRLGGGCRRTPVRHVFPASRRCTRWENGDLGPGSCGRARGGPKGCGGARQGEPERQDDGRCAHPGNREGQAVARQRSARRRGAGRGGRCGRERDARDDSAQGAEGTRQLSRRSQHRSPGPGRDLVLPDAPGVERQPGGAAPASKNDLVRRMGMAEKKYAAAVDQGTTGTRFMVFSHDGKVVSTDYLEHEQIYPKPGWVEHDAMEIWDKTQRVIKGSMAKKGIKADELSGIGVTNQRETTVVWEKKTGKPVHNAIVWQDTRPIDICRKLIKDGVEPMGKAKTGLVVATYFSGPKIQWILDNVSGARPGGERGDLLFGNIDTWVIWWLTGGPEGGAHVTDYSNASRTMLMDLKTLDWDAELLSKIKVPRAMLPQIRPSSDKKVYGQTKANGAVGGVVPVCADLGDQQAALFGQTCYSPGEAKNTYGTGNFMLLNTGTSPVPSKSGLLTTAAYGLEQGKSIYALEGSIAITGAAIQWLRDNLGLIKDASETEAIAKSVEDAGGIYFVPAFSGLFAPHWDMYARGAIVGLTRYVTRAHIVRATLEAICYQTKEVADAMEADSGVKLTTLKVDRGAVKNDFLMQLQADILGVQVIRPKVQETTSLGAAYGAGLATGFWSTLDELRKNWQVDKVFEPKSTAEQRGAGLAGWKKAVERTLGWVEKEPAKQAVGAGAKS